MAFGRSGIVKRSPLGKRIFVPLDCVEPNACSMELLRFALLNLHTCMFCIRLRIQQRPPTLIQLHSQVSPIHYFTPSLAQKCPLPISDLPSSSLYAAQIAASTHFCQWIDYSRSFPLPLLTHVPSQSCFAAHL